MKNLETLIKNNNATIVDVRSQSEFMRGHVENSINIPLQEIPNKINELKQMTNLVLCCASGNRSGQAAHYLKQKGIDCENAGSWLDINFMKQNLHSN